ncbi:MAG: hypothetical protein AAGA54_31490 [Myxococcota bacterium]
MAAAATVSLSVGTWVFGHACPASEDMVVVDVVEAPTREAAPVFPAHAPTEPEQKPLVYGSHVAFVIDLETPHIVLSTHVEDAWVDGALELQGVDTVFRDVMLEALPPEATAMLDRDVALYGPDDSGATISLGTARVGMPRIVSQASGSLGADASLETWELYEMNARTGTLPPGVAARASKAIWDDGQRLLVAPLEGDTAGMATWARDASLPEPLFYAPKPLERSSLAAEMETAFVTMPRGLDAVVEHERLGHGSLVPFLKTTGWTSPEGKLGLLTTFIDSPNLEWCGGFDMVASSAAHVFDGTVAAPAPIPTWHTESPAVVADFNLDGYVDLMLEPRTLDGDTVFVQGTAQGMAVLENLPEVPYFGCRC